MTAYRYTQNEPERRAKQRASLMRTLGIPDGHRRVYGVFVPEQHWQPLQYYATRVASIGGPEAARQFVLDCEASSWAYEYVSPKRRSEYWADWKLAKELYDEGVSIREIAEFFNMGAERVERARRRKWKRGL